ncbi:thiamine pyrophosphate-binding protein [Dactylosporangium sp. NPDC051485]|uniref:thiamine pyrophosphate-binding protein n=1 Tax=Dactylosporangium sp. NPDC051485 TaxID=3154846 RepID=UPI0034254FFA
MKAYEALAESLFRCGVRTMFGVLGDANMQYVSAFTDQQSARFVGAVVEGSAVGMADGFHRATQELGVVSVTHGPGFTNALTALTEAVRARSSLLLLTGAPAVRRHHPQQLDLQAGARLAGADYWRVLKAEHLADDLHNLAGRAVRDGQAIVVDVPFELLDAQVPAPTRTAPRARRPVIPADEEALDQALGIAFSARKPVILAGHGAVLADAGDELRELAAVLRAPLCTTLLARDLFRDAEFNLGIMGTLSTDVASQVLADADCLLVFGAGLNGYTTLEGELLGDRAVVRCDADPRAQFRRGDHGHFVLGDAKLVARSMVDALSGVDRPATASLCTEALAKQLASAHPRDDFEDSSTPRHLDMRTAVIDLDELLPPDRFVVTDAGRFIQAAWRYLHVGKPGRFTHATNFGSIGLSLGLGLGVALADPSRPTVVVAGDGGTMMNLIEFSTAARERLPLVLVVLNDGSYGAEYTKLEQFGLDPALSLMQWPDLARVAEALGGHGVTVRTRTELAEAVGTAGAGQLPLLIDVQVDPRVDITARRQRPR